MSSPPKSAPENLQQQEGQTDSKQTVERTDTPEVSWTVGAGGCWRVEAANEAGGKGRSRASVRPKVEEKFAMMPDAILFLIKQVGANRLMSLESQSNGQ